MSGGALPLTYPKGCFAFVCPKFLFYEEKRFVFCKIQYVESGDLKVSKQLSSKTTSLAKLTFSA